MPGICRGTQCRACAAGGRCRWAGGKGWVGANDVTPARAACVELFMLRRCGVRGSMWVVHALRFGKSGH